MSITPAERRAIQEARRSVRAEIKAIEARLLKNNKAWQRERARRARAFARRDAKAQALLRLEAEQARCVGTTSGKYPLPAYLKDDD